MRVRKLSSQVTDKHAQSENMEIPTEQGAHGSHGDKQVMWHWKVVSPA